MHFDAGLGNVRWYPQGAAIGDLRQQGINKNLRLIQDFIVIVWIVRLWTKHRLVAVRCINRRTPSIGVAPDVDAIPSVVMSLISHASTYRPTYTRSQRSFPVGPRVFGDATYTDQSHRPWN